MGQPFVHVTYDFGAADRLDAALAAAHAKVTDLISLRANQRARLLGAPHSDDWQGAKRMVFEQEFHAEQGRLSALADEIRRLMSAAAQATDQAHAVNSRAR